MLGSAPRVPEATAENPSAEPDKMIRRAYSIASSSLERRYVEFYLTLITSGALTPRLFALKHGHRVFLGPKASGIFTLDKVAPEKAVVLIATGTGLAPYVSMLRTLLVNDGQRKFVVLHGARYSWDLGYCGELESLARLRPNFTYIPSITRPDEDPHFIGHTGRIQALMERGVLEKESGVSLDPAKCEVFLCGNPDMVKVATELLQGKGFARKGGTAPATIHVEEYW
jgi:ferredoxin--NADP+ reductase